MCAACAPRRSRTACENWSDSWQSCHRWGRPGCWTRCTRCTPLARGQARLIECSSQGDAMTMEQDKLVAQLEPGVARLAARGIRRSYRKNTIILNEGEPGDS